MHPGGDFDVFGGEELGGVGRLGAGDVEGVGGGHDAHGAVFFVAVVDGDPGGHTGTGLDAEVEVVLVEVLPAGAGGFEVEHGLGRDGLVGEEIGEAVFEAFVEEVAEGEGADVFVGMAVGVHHAGIAGEGVVGVVGGDIFAGGFGEAGDGPVGVLGHEGFADFGDFGFGEESAFDVVAVAVEVGELFFGEGAGCGLDGHGGSFVGPMIRLFDWIAGCAGNGGGC